MKIEKSLVQQIVREEVIKAKKLIILKEEKQRIIKQLNELYGEDVIEEDASLLDLINPKEKQNIVQGIQQAGGGQNNNVNGAQKVAQPGAKQTGNTNMGQVTPQNLQEGFDLNKIFNGLKLSNIKNIVFGKIAKEHPEDFKKFKDAVSKSNYVGKSVDQIYNNIKQQAPVTEGKIGDVVHTIAKILVSTIGVGIGAEFVYIALMILTGWGLAIPAIMGSAILISLVALAAAGLIYIITSAFAKR
jgi:hypothetical protein